MTGFENFDRQFETATTTSRKQSASKLADGEYEVQVTAGEMKDDEHGPRVAIYMTVLAPTHVGVKVDKTYWLTKKGKDGTREPDPMRFDELKSDLATMGFDVANWTAANKRPFSAQLALACHVMTDIKLKVKKKLKDDYHNLYLNKRLDDGKPQAFTAEHMVAPPVQNTNSPLTMPGEAPPPAAGTVPGATVTPPSNEPIPF